MSRLGVWRWGVVLACVLVLVGPAAVVQAETPDSRCYEVRPGDTLTAIAARFGIPVRTLMRDNGIRDPRDLRVGQLLTLSAATGVEGVRVAVDSGADLLSLSRAAGMVPATLAHANHLVRPTELPLGFVVWVPHHAPVAMVPADDRPVMHLAPRVIAAARYGMRLWDVLRLNPLPGSLGQPLLVSADAGRPDEPVNVAGGTLPYPVERVRVSAQPISRGDTAVVTVETEVPVACRFSYLDKSEACLDPTGEGRRLHSLVALSPMLTPGVVTVTIELRTADNEVLALAVPLHVAAGRFDYERIDLPSDRQSLLDPQLSQAEAAKVAALRPLRSPVRHWTYPFRRPVASAVTSFFGSRRSYGYGFGGYHAGTDYDGEIGMPVIAPSGGVVVLAEPLVVRGNAIVIDHGWGVVSGYWHLSEIGVAVGQHVAHGERIGAVGNTGLSTGAHLHWELWVNGVAVTALSWLDPDGAASVLGPTP